MTGTRFTPRDMLARLVAFDTTSRDGNLPLIDFVESYLADWGVKSLRVDFESGKKTNLYATIGPEDLGGIVLSGHTDVVPVDGQDWTTDPFTMTEKDGLLYGRGTCDMKGFLATALALVPDFKAAKLKVPIHLALSCDEEVGCVGVRPLVAYIKEHLPKPKAVIVGEPTLMKVVNAHKGAHTFATEVTGLEAHSSCTHLGVNSILVAGELLTEIGRIAADMRERGDPSGRFNPPYTTVHVGLIEGGTAKNIIPRRCGFRWETRLLPGADPEEVPTRFNAFARTLEPAMHAVSSDTGIRTDRTNVVPGLRPEQDSPAEHLALHLAEANGAEAVSYCTEAGLFQEIGIPAIICGPGSIEQAHKPDEFIAISEMEKCETFMKRLIRHCVN
ncbi:acetylornithine deacetylase [Nordella sp. HKS 07]|uniref:acetylornithine deacetylase n=1 Tax=Nordella sp. HKS 07 TaxID=2712222 RepID=UPI0013E1C2F2|nr:acetylornithine deacetylase [Nordella sp. HKS 07]QIG48936.1 acetylornithine deacetylase [Nordella sp. HKS 07]